MYYHSYSNRPVIQMITDLAHDLGFSVFCDDLNWFLQISGNNRNMFIYRYRFPNTPASVSDLCCRKSELSALLNTNSIPAVPHICFDRDLLTETSEQHKQLFDLLKTHSSLVIKPNEGTLGRGVYKVTEPDVLIQKATELFSYNEYLAVCPYLNILHEYRVVVLNQTVRLIFEKQRTGTEWRHNLSNGAVPKDVSDASLCTVLEQLALRCARLLELNFGSVDIIETSTGVFVLEINSGVMLESYAAQSPQAYQKVKEIYKDAILSYFNHSLQNL